MAQTKQQVEKKEFKKINLLITYKKADAII
jgi:hypothetical protein